MEDDPSPQNTSTRRRRNVPRQNAIVATTSSLSEDGSPFVVKSRNWRQRKAPVNESNDELDSSEDFSVDFAKPVAQTKQKQKAASTRKTRAKQQRRDSNSENEAPKKVEPRKLPKPQRPPITTKTRTRYAKYAFLRLVQFDQKQYSFVNKF